MILDQTFTFAAKHNVMKSYLWSMLLIAIFSLNSHAQETAVREDAIKISKDDFRQLCGFMTGDFSSEIQSQNDTDYYDIRLHMAPLWPDSKDGYWLYVEQAMASQPDKPYRQRFYKVILKDDFTIESMVYTINEPLRFAGAWAKPELLQGINTDSLETRTGCSIMLKKVAPGIYEGSTNGKDCPSNLRGASYATSQVTINSQKMVSWDRGFDKNGKQVWGAEKGGYVFLKDGSE